MNFQNLLQASWHIFLFAVPPLIITVTLRTIYLGVYNLFFHPLRHYPGPKLWAVSIVPFAYHQLRGTDIFCILDFHKRFGSVVRIGPNALSYANEAVHHDVLGHRKPGQEEFGKSNTFTMTPVNGVPGILFATRENHSRHRRALAASFSEKSMKRQQPLITRYVNNLISGLGEEREDKVIDISAWFNWTSFDSKSAISTKI
jgi:hypothetical protein